MPVPNIIKIANAKSYRVTQKIRTKSRMPKHWVATTAKQVDKSKGKHDNSSEFSVEAVSVRLRVLENVSR